MEAIACMPKDGKFSCVGTMYAKSVMSYRLT